MPLYDHRCEDNHRFEASYSYTDPIPVCPRCGKKAHRIIVETPHIALNWQMPSSRDDGHTRTVIHRSRRGKSSPMDESAGRG